MNRRTTALWRWAVGEAWLLSLGCVALVFGFSWLFCRLVGVLDLAALADFVGTLPDFFKRLSAIPVAKLAEPRGMLALLFVHPVILGTGIAWCVARGSDVVSGSLERGALELVLAQPLRRSKLFVVHTAITIVGATLLALGVWLGLGVGLATGSLAQAPPLREFLPAVVNYFALLVCLSGLVSLLSACDSYRWRTIGLGLAFVLTQYVLKVIVRMWPAGKALDYLTIFGPYEPQWLIQNPAQAWGPALLYAGVLLGVGAASLILALAVFARRDLPPPM
jgi:ABC-2 type transport system permease protein